VLRLKKIFWYQRRIAQSGGGERFALEVCRACEGHGRLVTFLYKDDVFGGHYEDHILLLNRKTEYPSLLKRVVALAGAMRASDPDATWVCSGTWGHVIDIALASVLARRSYRTFIWGSPFQFKYPNEKSKYLGRLRGAGRKILEVYPEYWEASPERRLRFFELVVTSANFLIKKWAVKRSDRVYTLSHQNSFHVRQIYGVEASAHYAVSRAGKVGSRKIEVDKGDKLKLFTVSRLAENKRIDMLLNSAAVLFSRGFEVELHIVGTGAERSALEEYAIELGLGDAVKFLEYLSDDEILKRFSSEWIFCSFDLADFDLSPLERLAEGYRVVVSKPFEANSLTTAHPQFCIASRDAIGFASMVEQVAQLTTYHTHAEEFDKASWSALSAILADTN
jgi:glycosyltransferase involved in cell wall biosynthesis